MPIQKIVAGRFPVKIWTDHVEDASMVQLRNLGDLPFIHKHVAVMPDVHWGNGTSVGTVLATKHAIVPAAVGVDIGCGMMAAHLNLMAWELPDNLSELRSAIEAAIPHGRTHEGRQGDRGAWGTPPPAVYSTWGTAYGDARLRKLMERHPKMFSAHTLDQQGPSQLGTLGTGNHFVELCLDKPGARFG